MAHSILHVEANPIQGASLEVHAQGGVIFLRMIMLGLQVHLINSCTLFMISNYRDTIKWLLVMTSVEKRN